MVRSRGQLRVWLLLGVLLAAGCGPLTVVVDERDAGRGADRDATASLPTDAAGDRGTADTTSHDTALPGSDRGDAGPSLDALPIDAAPAPLPGAPTLLELGGPIYRYLPYDVTWQEAADDVARGVTVVRFDVQESKDPTFASGVRTHVVSAPTLHLPLVKPRPGFGGEPSLVFYYRVRAESAAGHGPFSNVDSKVIVTTWQPEYDSAGYSYPNGPPFAFGTGAFAVDDIQANNSRGTFAKSGPGWLDTTDPNKGYLGHYWYVSVNGPLPPDGTEAARWTPTINRSGKWQVWVSMYRSENRDDHVEYFVTSADGDDLGPFVVSHLQDPALGADTAWVHLGDFNFASGTAGHVDLIWSAAGRSHSESVDAAAFKRVAR